MPPYSDGKTRAIAQRRNLLNIIRELEIDSRRCLQHAEVLRREVAQIEIELETTPKPAAFIRNGDGTLSPIASEPDP